MEAKNSKLDKKIIIFYLLGGVVIGVLTGFFGGGGGMLCVPLLIYAGKIEEKKAHATALAVILPLTVVSGAVYFLNNAYELSVGIPVGLGFIAGGVVGSLLLKKIPNKVLSVIFAVVMIAGGVKSIW